MEGGVVKEADKYGSSRRFNESVWLSLCPPAVQRAVVAWYCVTTSKQSSRGGTQADDPTWEPRYLGSPGR